jgi:hypothetical protein
VANKCASDYCDGSNCNRLGLFVDWHIVGLIAISSDRILMGIDGEFDNGSFLIDSTWSCWAFNLSNTFDSSAKRLYQLL